MNTKEFSIATRSRRSKNSTLQILTDIGTQTVTISQLESRSMEYYKGLFSNPQNSIPIVFQNIVFPMMANWLTQEPLEEVRANLFSFNNGKSPGHDGFILSFLENYG